MEDNRNINPLQSALRIVPAVLRSQLLLATQAYVGKVQDIVLRTERPICVYINNEQYYLTKNGCLTQSLSSQELAVASQQQVAECFNNACGYSVYSHINEIKEGFITIKGGHRVGITGTAVVSSGEVMNVRDISTVSVRISREIIGCADKITRDFYKDRGGILLCGSPCSGKTTVLRDVARLLSAEYAGRVSLIDTRGELAGVCQGMYQNNIGLCDVMDGYPRSKGIEQAIRSLSPQYIVCDEIGSHSDVQALLSGVNSGVRFVASIHADNREELLRHKNANEILGTQAFNKILFLSGRASPGVVKEEYTLEELCND